MKNQKLNQRQARQALYLFRFNFILKHVPGKSMGRADGFSRRPNWQEGVEKDNKDKTLLKPEQLTVRIVEMLIKGMDILEKIKKLDTKDNKMLKAVEEMKKAGIKVL